MADELAGHIRAEFSRAIGTLSILIQAKEWAVDPMPDGPAKDLLSDEIIILSAMRSRQAALLNQMQEKA